MTDSSELTKLVDQLAESLGESHTTLSTAESCTGGGLGKALTSTSGSSKWYVGGVISYSNGLKKKFLNVPISLIDTYGAVSEQVAQSMASGIAIAADSDIAISTTGVAGPSGGTEEKPVGTVCFGWYLSGSIQTEKCFFDGDRNAVREQSIIYSIKRLIELL